MEVGEAAIKILTLASIISNNFDIIDAITLMVNILRD